MLEVRQWARCIFIFAYAGEIGAQMEALLRHLFRANAAWNGLKYRGSGVRPMRYQTAISILPKIREWIGRQPQTSRLQGVMAFATVRLTGGGCVGPPPRRRAMPHPWQHPHSSISTMALGLGGDPKSAQPRKCDMPVHAHQIPLETAKSWAKRLTKTSKSLFPNAPWKLSQSQAALAQMLGFKFP